MTKPVVSDARMLEATGKTHDEWFAILDEWGATACNHSEIARHLIHDLGVEAWGWRGGTGRASRWATSGRVACGRSAR